MARKPIIAVIGGGSTASREGIALAEEVGFLIARADAILVCGGLNGVMEASAKGAKRGGGFTVGILPTGNKADANVYIDLPIATAMSTIKSFDMSATMLLTLAPNTLRTPISLVRISVVYVARPSSPRQAMKIANDENMENKVLKLKSLLYWRLKSSSRKL